MFVNRINNGNYSKPKIKEKVMKIWETIKKWFKIPPTPSTSVVSTVVTQEAQVNGNNPVIDLEQEKFARKSARNRLLFWIMLVVICAGMFTIATVVGEVVNIGGYSLQAWLPVFVSLCLYASVSFTTQDAGKVGAKLLFRGLFYETSPGLIFIPYGIFTHEERSVAVEQKELPTDVPELYGNEEDGSKVKYIRMTTKFPSSGSQKASDQNTNDPLETGRLTFNTLITVSFSVSNKPGAFFQYFTRMQTLERFLGIADDVAVGYVKKQVKQRSPSKVLEDWQDIENNATALLNESVKGYGVEDVKITVKEFGLSRDVNTALSERTAAQTNVETQRLKGEGEKKLNIEQAQGIQAKKKAELVGPFEALSEAIKKLGFTNEQALFLANQEAVARMYEKAKYSIVPSGKGGFMDQAAFMAVMQEAIQASSTVQQGNQNTQGGNTP